MMIRTYKFWISFFWIWISTSTFCQEIIISKKEEKVNKDLDKASEYIENEQDSALIYIRKAKELSKKYNYPIGLVKALELEGNFYGLVKNDYKKAADFYLEGIHIGEKEGIGYTKNVYFSLGKMFHVTDNYNKAQSYYRIALNLSKKEKDTLLIARSLINLGSINSSLKKFDIAEKLFLESLQYPTPFAIRTATFSNLGNLKIRQKKFKEAILYLNKVVQVNPETKTGGDAIDYSYLLRAKNGAKDIQGMDTILKNSHELVTTTNDLRAKTILISAMSETYQNLHNYKKASELKDQYITLYDSLKTMQRDEIVYEMESKYQTQKKEDEILKYQSDKEKLMVFITIALLTIALLSYLIYRNVKQKKLLKTQTKLLEIAVDEKNILLKETHHRVKNSFQIVSSLLYLQSENMKDKDAALAIKEAQNRVKSMVLIHQKLYTKDQLVGIETKEYIEDLVQDIVDNQSDTIPNLETQINTESVIFSIDTITPLGLIINELITNSIKHAFPKEVLNPKISIGFYKEKNYFVLTVQDNGIGIKKESNDNSFGIKLINALAKKLKAEVVFQNNNGTTVRMEIHKFEEM